MGQTAKFRAAACPTGTFPGPYDTTALLGQRSRGSGPVKADAVLVEAHDEWRVGERRCLSEGSMALLATPGKEMATSTLLTA